MITKWPCPVCAEEDATAAKPGYFEVEVAMAAADIWDRGDSARIDEITITSECCPLCGLVLSDDEEAYMVSRIRDEASHLIRGRTLSQIQRDEEYE